MSRLSVLNVSEDRYHYFFFDKVLFEVLHGAKTLQVRTQTFSRGSHAVYLENL